MPETNNIENNQAMQFDAIQIGLASPEKIREWSHGEVKKPETINYRTLKPEKDGLFCEKIFGPTKDWECHCGKYKKIRYKGVVCDRCGVEITKSSVRRERMGHIELAAPVSHIWYFKGIPSRMGLILDLSPRVLERVLYFASYIVLDPGETKLAYKQILNESEYQEACDTYGRSAFRVGMGAESIHELLAAIDLEKDSAELKAELENATGQKRARIIKRLEVVEAFRESGNKPEWMIMTVIPVIPPDLRPMVQLDGGRFATSDLNDLYRRIINRNNRLRRLLDLGAPDIIVRNEKRMLQEAVDALIDNGRRGRPVTGPGNRALKSLSDMLKGKGGRFRQNLLGKRVDYSGRSVICVEPKLKIYQCGLPKEMAIELFKPFVMKELAANGTAHNIKSAKKMVERLQPEVWDVLEDVIKEHPVMLNRAPTLHRLGIQAFEPILVEGKAIKLHPLVCTAFNADFDGDQMAVHLPLTAEAQAECRFMLLSPNNLLKPSDGGLVAVPSQDMILGVYYLTMRKLADYKDDPKMVAQVSSDTVYNDIEELRKLTTPDENTGKAELGLYDLIWFEDVTDGNRRVLCRPIDLLGRYYGSVNLAMLAYENKEITLHQNIFVHRTVKLADGTKVSGFTETTVGLLIFNENIPQDLGFIDRSKAENALKFEVEFHVGKKQIKQILEKVINTHGATTTAEVLDNVKAMGYKYSTQAAMTVSISDMTVPPQKPQMIADAQDTVDKITRQYKRGLITDEERYKEVIETWKDTDDALTKALLTGLDKYNNIFMMADSGARGSDKQIKQLAVDGAELLKKLADETEGDFSFEYSPESFHGTEVDYAVEVCNAVLDVWQPSAQNKAIINIPATVETAMPHVFATQIEYVSKNLKYRDNVVLSLHPHNDRGCGVSDAELGLLAGADRIEGTLFGNGERTGNVDIITVAMNMYSYGIDPQLDFSNMPHIREVYERLTRMQVNDRQPYAGNLVFSAFSGSHQDAIAKGMAWREEKKLNTWTVPYLPIDPVDVGRTYDSDVIRINRDRKSVV